MCRTVVKPPVDLSYIQMRAASIGRETPLYRILKQNTLYGINNTIKEYPTSYFSKPSI